MSTALQTRAKKLGGGKESFEPVDEVPVDDRDIDRMTLALTPDTWHLVCLQDELCQGKGTFFSITRDGALKGWQV